MSDVDLALALRLFDDAPIGLAVVRSRRVQRCNRRFEQIFGYEPGELTGQSTRLWYQNDAQWEEIPNAWRTAGDGSDHRELEAEFVRKDGLHIWVSMRSVVDELASDDHDGLYAYTDITARKRDQLDLLDSHNALRDLTMRLDLVREDERRFVARELHDEIGQYLSVMRMDISSLRERLREADPAVREDLARIDHLTVETLGAMRRLVDRLRPKHLDDGGLGPAIEQLGREAAQRCGFALEVELPAETLVVADDVATTIYRTVQECLNNIVKHAQAQRVAIVLAREAGGLRVRVTDDGRGYADRDRRKPGAYGLIGIRERANALGGSFRIEGGPEGGTRVEIVLPLRERSVSA